VYHKGLVTLRVRDARAPVPSAPVARLTPRHVVESTFMERVRSQDKE